MKVSVALYIPTEKTGRRLKARPGKVQQRISHRSCPAERAFSRPERIGHVTPMKRVPAQSGNSGGTAEFSVPGFLKPGFFLCVSCAECDLAAVLLQEKRRKEFAVKEKLEKIREEALGQIGAAQSLETLNEVRVSFLGKKGALTELLKGMKSVAPQDRPKVGQMVNEVRVLLENALEEKRSALEDALLEERMKEEVLDVTLPAKKNRVGHRHPNTIALEEVERIFVGMGYEVVEGPEVEKDYYNFEALNIPKDHPARDEQDTFYINDEIVLRTQTSPVQVRTMEQGKLPIRMIAPGRVFRSDEVDATHSPSFHQIEGLVIDKHITFADLKGTLAEFAKELFGEETKVKFRPHHFPFTEPSAEMDVSCFKCGGKGCRFCKGSGWIEILGCGMVHPKVLRMCDIDPEEYSGFAFGVGLERIALLKYEIDDMRLLFENDIRFLKQF